jgi:hypothetical protein
MKSAFTLLLSCCCFPLLSQRIANFQLSEFGTRVRIDFSVSKGSNCNGYTLFHSRDSIHYSIIEDYAGICSSTSEDLSFNYTHNDPAGMQYNYYKVELAFVESSEVKAIFVSGKNASAITLFPNPLLNNQEQLKLRIPGISNAALSGFIYDSGGMLVRELYLKQVDHFASFYVNELKNGLYLIWLNDGITAYSAKLIIGN